MMGKRDPQAPMWSYRVNLDKRLRRDHPLRRINEALDLRFERWQVAHTDDELLRKNPLLGQMKGCEDEGEVMPNIPQMGRGLDSASCD
jgi:hypothetical protein